MRQGRFSFEKRPHVNILMVYSQQCVYISFDIVSLLHKHLQRAKTTWVYACTYNLFKESLRCKGIDLLKVNFCQGEEEIIGPMPVAYSIMLSL